MSNHRLVRVNLGINPHCFEWVLNRDESFETPEAVMTFSERGFNGVSHNFHDFITVSYTHLFYHHIPNNWTGFFAEDCWEYDDKSGEYYLHLFSKKQPDLNYNNPKVLEEVKNILRFWLDKGISGFRCDVINLLYKTSLKDGKKRLALTGSEHYISQEGTHEIPVSYTHLPPMQKKHIVNVKFKASWEGVHPNSSVRGAFKIDQAYIIPAKSILTTPLNRYGHLTSLFFSCVFCIKNYPF